MIAYQNIYDKSQEEVLCHPAEEVQAQGAPGAEAAAPGAEAAQGAAVPAVGAVTGAARQEGGAALHIAVLTVVLIEALMEATVEAHQHIRFKEHEETSLPAYRHISRPRRLF